MPSLLITLTYRLSLLLLPTPSLALVLNIPMLDQTTFVFHWVEESGDPKLISVEISECVASTPKIGFNTSDFQGRLTFTLELLLYGFCTSRIFPNVENSIERQETPYSRAL